MRHFVQLEVFVDGNIEVEVSQSVAQIFTIDVRSLSANWNWLEKGFRESEGWCHKGTKDGKREGRRIVYFLTCFSSLELG